METGTLEIRIDEGGFSNYSSPVAVPEMTGNHTIYARTVDIVGNKTNADPLQVFMDITSPVSTLELKGAVYTLRDVTYIHPTTELVFSATDEHSGVKTITGQINGGTWRDLSKPITLGSEGNKQLKYAAIDNVNNRENIKDMLIIVDSSPPDLSWQFSEDAIGKEGGVDVYPSGTTLYLEAKDAISAVERILYKIGDEEYLYRTPLSALATEEILEIEVTAIDRLGNSATKTIRCMFR
ncbi:hypothetical protein K8I28_01735 [bacterium]|nr:hypothetical protein [bacterium]